MDEDVMIQSFSPLEIKQLGGTRIEVFQGIPSKMNPTYKLPGFERLHTIGGFGAMSFFHYAGDGFDIWYSNYEMTTKSAFIARADFPALELHIPVNHDFTSRWDDQKEKPIRDKQFELSYFPFIHSASEFAGGFEYSTFDIHYSPAYLKKFAGHSPGLAAFLEKVEKRERADLLKDPQFLSPSMMGLVSRVLHCNMTAEMAPFYYESVAQLMLIEVLQRLNELSGKGSIKYSPYDIERTIAAKEIIVSDLSIKYNIGSLSRATGFNEWKLQHTFKHLFGATIFDYAQSARLEHAKRLLRDTADPIQLIAMQCGYPDHSNLTAAFRKRFGCTPEQFRSSGK
jgi:AraC family transcriptional regulator, transcriptional activator of the genes for pyochelin and ferripyochelin receptors